MPRQLSTTTVGSAICAIALVVRREVRRATASTTLRVMTWVSTVAVIGWLIGQLGELVTVLTIIRRVRR